MGKGEAEAQEGCQPPWVLDPHLLCWCPGFRNASHARSEEMEATAEPVNDHGLNFQIDNFKLSA